MSVSASQTITRKSASNLALSFILLPRPKREAMSALYAFCREVDDVADEDAVPVEQRRARLSEWRADLAAAFGNGTPAFEVNRELQPIIRRYRLPKEHFDELIRGVEMDLDTFRYPDYAALEQYCYRVASVVGLLSIEVFGYRNARCLEYAVHLGKALQLTNILRDVRVDASRGRIYLPTQELARFQVTPEEILRFEYSSRFQRLATSVAAEAHTHYRKASEALPPEDRRAMMSAELMGTVYWRLLRKLEARKFNVFGPAPTRISKGQKLLLVLQMWWRSTAGGFAPSYGGRS